MPKFLEDKLKAEAAKKGFSGRRAARYVYGTMNNLGAMRGNKETAKGARMQEKHDAEHPDAKRADARREKMRSDIAKFKGKSSEASFRRPKRKVLNRYA